MKYLILFLLLSFTTGAKVIKSKIITVYIFNDPNERPVTSDIYTFWANKKFFDTIQIQSERLHAFIISKTEKLKKEDLEYEFSVKAAVIINRNNKIDTFYTDKFFKDWYINGKNYTDNKRDLGKMFGGFFLFQYD